MDGRTDGYLLYNIDIIPSLSTLVLLLIYLCRLGLYHIFVASLVYWSRACRYLVAADTFRGLPYLKTSEVCINKSVPTCCSLLGSSLLDEVV